MPFSVCGEIRVCELQMETISVLIMASRIRKFVKTQFFLLIRLASTRIQRIFRPYLEIFENALQSGNFFVGYECGWSYLEIGEYAYIIL